MKTRSAQALSPRTPPQMQESDQLKHKLHGAVWLAEVPCRAKTGSGKRGRHAAQGQSVKGGTEHSK